MSVPSLAGTDPRLLHASAGEFRSASRPVSPGRRASVEGDPVGGGLVPASRSTGAPAEGNRDSSTSRVPAYPLPGAGGLSASGTGSLRLTRCEPPARDGRPSRPA